MKYVTRDRRNATTASVVLILVLGGCGGGSDDAADNPGAGPATSAATTSTATSPDATTSAPGHTYRTSAFVVPFDVKVPDWLPADVTTDQSNFVTWEPPSSEDPAVRALVPVAVYAPGDTEAMPPPEDYLAYLLSQSQYGASFTDSTTTTVGGRPATIVTATAPESLDGSLGCAATDLAADDCFGLQPELALRVAVIDAGDHPLLIWLRHQGAADDESAAQEFDAFAQMLDTIEFRDAAPSSPTVSSAASAVDGTWRTTITKAELEDSPLLEGPDEVNDENYGDFTLTFGDGRFELDQTTPPHSSIAGTFTLEGDALRLDLASGERFDMRCSVDGDVLKLTRDEALGVGPTPLVLHHWHRG